MRAVIYARYSCDNQREESIEGQLRECRAFAERKGFNLVGSYIDRAMSAKTDNSPEFQRMVKESGKEFFDVIIVWKLDRFARNRYDSAHYKAILRKNGVKVVSATEVISEGAEGIILEAVLEGYAEYYSAELSEKVIRGMTENALKCQYNGGYVLVGYKIDEKKRFQLDELTAPFVKEAFLMYINGRQLKDVAKFLNDNGVLSSRKLPMTITSVSAILQNRRYMGEYRYRDIVVPEGIPPIISKELFAMAQGRLERNRYTPSSYKSYDRYLLTTKLVCSDCGAYMVGESGTGRTGKKYHYYKCVTAKKKCGCERKAVRKEDIEDVVIDNTIDFIFDEEVIEGLADRVVKWLQKDDTTVPLLQRELAEVEQALDNVMKAVEQGIINSTTRKRMSELEEQKTDLQVKIAREEIQANILTKEQVIFWLSNMQKLNLATAENRQRIIDTFINLIHVYDDRLVINFNCREESETIPLELSKKVSRLRESGEPLNSRKVLREFLFSLRLHVIKGVRKYMEEIFDKLLEFLREVLGLSENVESITGNVESTTGNIESIFGFIDSIAESGASISASNASTMASVVFLVMIAISFFGVILDVIVYLFRSVGMCKLSKKAGRKDGWLAFVPVAWHYVLCDISDKPFTLFGKKIGKKRTSAFWLWFIFRYFGGWVIDILGIIISMFVMTIPYVGTVIGSILMIVLPILPNIFCAIIRGKFLYDAAELFRPDHRNNKTICVLSILVEEIFSSDLITLILIWNMLRYTPAVKEDEPEKVLLETEVL